MNVVYFVGGFCLGGLSVEGFLNMDFFEGFKDSKIKAVLIRELGLMAVGENLNADFHVVSLVEDSAKVASSKFTYKEMRQIS